MRDEVVVLVRGERGPHRVDEEPVEVGTADPVEHDLVQMGEPAGAEVRVGLDLEVVVGQAAVGLELLPVAQVVPVGDVEVLSGVEVVVLPASGGSALHGPLYKRLHGQRE